MRPKVRNTKLEGREAAVLPPSSRPKKGLVRSEQQISARALKAGFSDTLPRATRYVVTAAQDGSPVHMPFFRALQKYCELNDAALIVIPYLYRALKERKQEDKEVHADRWAPELKPYLFAGRRHVNSNLIIMGDVKITPTKQAPLAGLDSMSLGCSAIFGHPKLELKTVPTLDPEHPTILTTTGVVTQSDYVDALASKIAEFHHAQAACVIEVDGDWFTIRQLNADTNTGEFTDLYTVYSERGARKAPRPLALVLGDMHVGFVDPFVHSATFGSDGIVAELEPRHIVYHDLLDGYSVNPHHKGDPFIAVAKQGAAKHKVRAEVEAAAQYIEDNTPDNAVPVVVASNHDDFLNRWMRSADWRELGDKDNALFYLETAARMVAASDIGPGGYEGIDPFHLWAQPICPRAKFLRRRESFELGGVELSLHFDVGPNGSRGSIRNLRRIGRKTIGGHSHAPGISEGAMQTGTSSLLQLEYNRPPSSWAHAHALLYASGKRSLIFIRDGRYRLR